MKPVLCLEGNVLEHSEKMRIAYSCPCDQEYF